MKRFFNIALLAVIFLLPGRLCAQSSEIINSPFNAKTLYELACEVYNWPGAGPRERSQAMVMLNAVYEMDGQADYIFPKVIDLALKSRESDYTDAMLLSLRKYLRSDSDLIPAMQATKYILGRQNTREEREAVLNLLTRQVGARNNIYMSEISTELGFLHIEKGDTRSAAGLFTNAYQLNPFNDLAFRKLAEISPESIGDVDVAMHHRFMLANNPLNFSAVVSFASYAYGMGLYNESFLAWQYAGDLFDYLNPGQPLPADIYLPMALAGLNSEGNLSNVLQWISGIEINSKSL